MNKHTFHLVDYYYNNNFIMAIYFFFKLLPPMKFSLMKTDNSMNWMW